VDVKLLVSKDTTRVVLVGAHHRRTKKQAKAEFQLSGHSRQAAHKEQLTRPAPVHPTMSAKEWSTSAGPTRTLLEGRAIMTPTLKVPSAHDQRLSAA